MGQPLDLHVGAPKPHEHLRDQSRDERKCGHDDERGAGAGSEVHTRRARARGCWLTSTRRYKLAKVASTNVGSKRNPGTRATRYATRRAGSFESAQ